MTATVMDILLVDDLPEALALIEAAACDAFPDAACTAAINVAQALAACRQRSFSLALVDLGLPDGAGVDVIAHLRQQQPGCNVVVTSIYDDDAHLFEALQSGAQGYLLKDQAPGRLAQQLRGIVDGQPPLSPAIARRLVQHFQRLSGPTRGELADLTGRERTVLGLLAQGIRIVDIAADLGISPHTAGDHVKNIYRKLNISSRAEAALRARRMGLA